MPLITNQARVDQAWTYLSAADESDAVEAALQQSTNLVVDWAIWQDRKDQLQNSGLIVGVKLPVDLDVAEIAGELADIPVIALDFPSFGEGRAFSQARLLKQSHGYQGEIRAVGDVTWDRLRFMHRCGFDSFEIADDRYSDEMFNAFTEISVSLQGAVDDPRPIYRQ